MTEKEFWSSTFRKLYVLQNEFIKENDEMNSQLDNGGGSGKVPKMSNMREGSSADLL